MKKLALSLSTIIFSAAACAGPIVNVKGDLYEIEVVGGLLYQVRSMLESQVWFGDPFLAQALSNEVGDAFGEPNYGLYGPMFAHRIYDGVGADYTTGFVYYSSRLSNPPDNRAQENNAAAGAGYTFATGTYVGRATVPEPSTLSLLGISAIFLLGRGRIEQRRKAFVAWLATRELAKS